MPSLGRIVLLALVLWLAGLAWFVWDALQPSAVPAPADGIVVLTGDAVRVDAALALLKRGRARLLLISGAGPRTTLRSLARREYVPDAQLAARVTLGRNAVSTWGNGAEFADWARGNGIRSAIVVTSFYHMRRALLELHRAAPEVTLRGVKVPADPRVARLTAADWRKLVEDYDKYLLALAGASRFSPGHGAA